jgi:tRNA(fMet)-specific endonuclease VapC
MSRYVLDTDMLTLYQDGHPSVCQKVAAHRPEELATTIISVEEQLTGWLAMLRRAKNREMLANVYHRFTENTAFLARLNILTFTLPAIDRSRGDGSQFRGNTRRPICSAAGSHRAA